MTRPARGRAVVLSGPSGVGKDTVLARMFELCPELTYSVSYTTRTPRAGEVDGVSYSFVDEPTFRRMIAEGRFLEWATVHGNLYGTSLDRVRHEVEEGRDVVLKIDVQGAASVRPLLPDGLFIFLEPPDMETLRDRLGGRNTEDGGAVEARLDQAERELDEARRYDHRVVNDVVDRAAREIVGIIRRSRDPDPAPRGGSG